MQGGAWQVVLPVKGGSAAKSRLAAATPSRVSLARALALDCLSAVLASPPVGAALVVSADPVVLDEAGRLGARGVPERAAQRGLNAAVAQGLGRADGGAVAVLLADLPCLRPADVDTALAACSRAFERGAAAAIVPDATGTGTVLLAAPRAAALTPAFGPGSAAAHAAAGAARLDLDLPRLRRDVDTPEDLVEALLLGVGPRTRGALRRQDAASA